MSPLLAAIITGIFSGGLLSAGVAFYTAKRKVPAERTSIIVSGAETAVMALERTLAAETRRAQYAEDCVRLEREANELLRGQVRALEDKLDLLQQALDEARSEIGRLLHSADDDA